MNPSNFPLLQAAAAKVGERRLARFNEAISLLDESLQAGQIFNVDLVEAKDVLNRVYDDAFKVIREKYTYNGQYKLLPDAVYSFIDSLGLGSSCHEAIAASKKLAKVKLSHEAIDFARPIVAEGLVIAEALASLKSKVVKGRKPNPEAAARKAALAPKNPLARATCACCFGSHAVLPNGLIHDHGYRLPAGYWKTDSCYGRQFRPLEVSSDGLRFILDLASKFAVQCEKDLAALRVATEIRKVNRHSGKVVVISKADPLFAVRLGEEIQGAEYTLRRAKADVAELQKKLAAWKPAA